MPPRTLALVVLVLAVPLAAQPTSAILGMHGGPEVGRSSPLQLTALGAAGAPYVIGLSGDDRPGIALGGGTIALALDDLLRASTVTPPPAALQGFQGLLDQQGRAVAAIDLPADPALDGLSAYLSAVVWPIGGAPRIANTLYRTTSVPSGPADWSAVDQILDDYAAPRGIFGRTRGIGFAVIHEGRIVYQETRGPWNAQTRVRLASATKWVSALVLQRLVEQGLLSWEDRVAQWIPEFSGPKGAITLAQCFSHTSGLPGDYPCDGDFQISLGDCVLQIAAGPLAYAPGTTFHYGGASMQVAGRVAEIASGLDWHALVQRELVVGLGLSTLAYDAFGPTNNPRIGGDAAMSLEDYTSLLRLLSEGGAFGLRSFLPTVALQGMAASRTLGTTVGYSPDPSAAGYGLGQWIEEASTTNGRSLVVSSPGAFGTWPWIDHDKGYAAILMIEATTQIGRDLRNQLKPLVESRL